jgi:uncharacterized protein YfbU (UPF0304 family)
MKMTNAEKLMFVMLSEIHEELDIKDGVDTKLLKEAIYSDNTWAIEWEMPGIIQDNREEDPPEVKYVVDVLDMWSFLEEGYLALTAEGRKELESKAEIFGKNVKFTGFDGNNESKLCSIANFLVNEMGRFKIFEGRELNSHMQTMGMYKRMLNIFLPIRSSIVGRTLSIDEMAEILNSMAYPK